MIDPGRYQNLTDDFSAQINAFKSGGAQILTGIPIPPDFTTFWTQARQQGSNPRIATIAKALLFPESVQQLGNLGHNLCSEGYWTPQFPFTSSLTGESCADLVARFEEAAGRQWTQPVGFTHTLFEVAADAIKRADNPTDPEAEAVGATDLTPSLAASPGTSRTCPTLPRPQCRQDAASRRAGAAQGRRQLRSGDRGKRRCARHSGGRRT